MGMFKVRVAEVLEETSNIKTFRLTRTDGATFDPYPAGAHIDVLGPTSVLRQYSLCSPPHAADDYVIAVKREPESRGGSAALHGIRVGQELEISAPRNLLKVVQGADKNLLLAAGIGVTPMMSIAYHLQRENVPFELHYFARSSADAAFVELLRDRSGFGESVHFHFGLPRDKQALVLSSAFATLTRQSHIYTCGPEGFMDRVAEIGSAVVPEENIHVEHFQSSQPAETVDTAFEVELDSGEVFEVPVGKTVVDVLAENGVDIDTSCREGICGTCIMGVLEGIPDHRDQCLSSSEKKANDQMAACVSRAKSDRLVLELY